MRLRMSGARDNEATRPTEYPKYMSPMSPSEWPCPSSAIRKGMGVADGGEDKDTAGFGEKETGDPPALENGEEGGQITRAVEARAGVAHFRNASDEEEDKEKEKNR